MKQEATTTETADLPGVSSPPKSKVGAFIWTVGFAFSIVALQLGQGILLARLLGPEGRGEYAAAVIYVQLLLYIGLFGGIEVVCRYAAENTVDRMSLSRAALRLGITTGVATSLLAIALNMIALPGDKRYLVPIAVVCSLSILGQHAMLIMTAVDRGSGQFASYNARRFIAAAAFPFLLLVAAMMTSVTVTMAAVLFVVASLISLAACLIGIPQPWRGENHPATGTLVRESWPYGVSMLATDLFERLDLLLVLWLAPLVQQGYYASMVPAVYPLTVIPNTLGLFLFNAGADRSQSLRARDVTRILALTVAVQIASTIAFLVLIGPLVVLLYGQDFEPAIRFALWLAPVSAIKGVLQGLDSFLKGRGQPLAPIRARLVAMVVMVALTWLLFDQYGTVAIAMAALAGQVLCLVWLTILVYVDVMTAEPDTAEPDSGDISDLLN